MTGPEACAEAGAVRAARARRSGAAWRREFLITRVYLADGGLGARETRAVVPPSGESQGSALTVFVVRSDVALVSTVLAQ
jgi:hypothetical protein